MNQWHRKEKTKVQTEQFHPYAPRHPKMKDYNPQDTHQLKREMYAKIVQKPDPSTVEATLQKEEELWNS